MEIDIMAMLRALLPLALLAGCAPGPKTPSTLIHAEKLPYGALMAVKRDEPKLRQLLTDTTHKVRRISGSEIRYFGADGKALFLQETDGRVLTGEWTILPTRFFGYSICAAHGKLPEAMGGRKLVDNCQNVGKFVGIADYLSKGDPLGLRIRAP